MQERPHLIAYPRLVKQQARFSGSGCEESRWRAMGSLCLLFHNDLLQLPSSVK